MAGNASSVSATIDDVASLAAAVAAVLLLMLEPESSAIDDDGLTQRLEAVSRQLLGAPYVLGPLGEEVPPDLDPRFRLDAFDCTTYVETVLALAVGGSDDEAAARSWLDRIRYTGGMPVFAKRRHLIDAQWIPELEQDGLLLDVTRRIGGSAARTASLRLNRATWQRSHLATDLGLEWSAVPHGRKTLAYLPWEVLERDDVRAALPSAAILNLIANPTPSAPTLVIHQALLLRAEDGGWIARHASSSSHRVVEEPLDVFLQRSRGRKRSVLGVNVLEILGVR
jgi:hypothetical protein